MEDADFDALGAQYREAKASIAVHRARQAQAELALSTARRVHREGSPEVAAARASVDRAHTDVRWCQAVTIAAGEAFKGVRFKDIPNDRAASIGLDGGLRLLEQGGE